MTHPPTGLLKAANSNVGGRLWPDMKRSPGGIGKYIAHHPFQEGKMKIYVHV